MKQHTTPSLGCKSRDVTLIAGSPSKDALYKVRSRMVLSSGYKVSVSATAKMESGVTVRCDS